METLGEGFHEDCVRAFFRLKVADLGEILPHVTELLKRNHRNLSHHIVEANQILLVCTISAHASKLRCDHAFQTILQSSISYREFNLGIYGIELPLIDPWTSQPRIIDIVAEFFKNTTTFIESSSAHQDNAPAKDALKEQMPDLASTLFGCVQERLDWLGR